MRAVMAEVSTDLLAWRKKTGVDRFDEIWKGVLHMNAAPHRDHQVLQDDLREWLKRWWARPCGGTAVCQRNVASPTGWPNDYRIPDIVLMTPDRQAYDQGEYIAGPPLVVIEIRSPNDESYEKLPFYAELNVPEVWVINRDSKSPEIYVLQDAVFHSVLAQPQGWLMSPATNVMVKATEKFCLSIQLEGKPETRCELPED